VIVAQIREAVLGEEAIKAYSAAVAHTAAVNASFIRVELAVEAGGGGGGHGGGRGGQSGGSGALVCDAIAIGAIVAVGTSAAGGAAMARATTVDVSLSAIELLVNAGCRRGLHRGCNSGWAAVGGGEGSRLPGVALAGGATETGTIASNHADATGFAAPAVATAIDVGLADVEHCVDAVGRGGCWCGGITGDDHRLIANADVVSAHLTGAVITVGALAVTHAAPA
jgi:hypothetical protein